MESRARCSLNGWTETITSPPEGLRVIAVARKHVGSSDVAPYAELELLGLVALRDPPREE